MKKRAILGQLAVLLASVALLCVYNICDAMRTDRTAPQIEVAAGELSLSVEAPKSALLEGVVAVDDVDGDVTDQIVIESVYGVTDQHCITVTYAAFDHSGNVSKKERTVRYTDYQSPRFSLSESLTYPFGEGFDVMAAVGAEDVFDGDIQRLVKATMLTSGTTVKEEGMHDVQFRVTNSVGDTAQLILPVEVYPADSYNAELYLSTYLVYLNPGDSFDADEFVTEFQYLGRTVDLREKRPEMMNVKISGSVNTQVPGVYPISYLASYSLDGRTFTGYAKLFAVVEG